MQRLASWLNSKHIVHRHLCSTLPPGSMERIEPVSRDEALAALEQVEAKALAVLREEAPTWDGEVPGKLPAAATALPCEEDMAAFT